MSDLRDDSRVLPFPDGTDAVEPALARALETRLAASYAAIPETEAAVVTACTAAVLAQARQHRGFRPRWWWGAAAAAALVIVVTRPWRPDDLQQAASGVVREAMTAPPEAPTALVQQGADGVVRFSLTVPAGAKQVALVGDFNGWDAKATPMTRGAADAPWSARVPLPPGRHVYAFVVDGTHWLVDPLAPQVPDDELGPANAVIVGESPQ